MKYYLIGIKGTGMSALANTLVDLKHEVVGSDVKDYYFTQETLYQKGIKALEFDKENIKENYIYIISNAYNQDNNEEVMEVINKGYIYYYYQDFINYFFDRIKIGISGTHGKTTTTAMISKFLEDDEIAYLIGDSTGFADENYKYFIFEACEYQNHFLHYDFDYLLINNIDYDHPDFFKNIDDVISSFQKAADKCKVLVINNDDENCRKISHKNKITFGQQEGSTIRIKSYIEYKGGFDVTLLIDDEIHKYFVPFTGFHMVYNFVGSIACLYALNYLNIDIQDKILNMNLPKRRMQEYYYYSNVLIDDYAHHPTEIKCLVKGISQKYPDKKIVVIFQPHTYSRTLALEKEFNSCFEDVDELYIARTFTSKRENYDSNKEKEVMSCFNNAKNYSEKILNKILNYENSVIVFLGAGTINNDLKSILSKNEKRMKK